MSAATHGEAATAAALRPGGSLPAGWAHLGTGASRWVWLAPSGVAYKVERYPQGCSNEEEYGILANIQNGNVSWCDDIDPDYASDLLDDARDLVPGFAALFQDLGRDVLAMEHVPLPWGCRDCDASDWKLCSACEGGELHRIWAVARQVGGSGDVHADNVRRRADGTPVLIDWA